MTVDKDQCYKDSTKLKLETNGSFFSFMCPESLLMGNTPSLRRLRIQPRHKPKVHGDGVTDSPSQDYFIVSLRCKPALVNCDKPNVYYYEACSSKQILLNIDTFACTIFYRERNDGDASRRWYLTTLPKYLWLTSRAGPFWIKSLTRPFAICRKACSYSSPCGLPAMTKFLLCEWIRLNYLVPSRI